MGASFGHRRKLARRIVAGRKLAGRKLARCLLAGSFLAGSELARCLLAGRLVARRLVAGHPVVINVLGLNATCASTTEAQVLVSGTDSVLMGEMTVNGDG